MKALVPLARRRPPFAPAVAAAAVLAVLLSLVLAGPASAVVAYPALGEITGPAPGEPFFGLKSESVAVNDHNGHIYVADSRLGKVYDFASTSDTNPAVWTGSGTPAGSFGGGDVAVAADNASGDVYVADATHKVIDKFEQDGTLISSFGDTPGAHNGQLAGLATPAGSFAPASEGGFGIAVDQATHDLYAIDAGHQVIDAFDENGTFLPAKQITASPGELYGEGGAYTDGIAINDQTEEVLVSGSWDLTVYRFSFAGALLGEIDGSNTPALSFGNGYISVTANNTSGDIYVTDTAHHVVDRFASAGAYLDQVTGAPNEPFGGVSVDQASAELYVADGGAGAVEIFGPEAVLLADPTTAEAGEVSPSTVKLNGEVNPAGTEASYQFEYGTSASYGQLAPASPVLVGNDSSEHPESAEITGLQPNTTYHFRIDAINPNGTNFGADQTFRTTGPPAVEETSASGITRNCATLEAQVNPDGFETSVRFQYGPSSAYGSETASVDIGAGTTPQPAVTEVCGLTLGTTYHFRAVATSAAEPAGVNGPDTTFTTVPALRIDSTSVSGVSATGATLETEINPLGEATTYHFEYDTTPYVEGGPAHGTSTPNGSAGSDTIAITRSTPIQGLQSLSTYHFRVVAENALGVVIGPDRSFTTQPAAPATLLPDGRGWELVSPPNKHGSPLLPIFPEGAVIQAAADGSGLSYAAQGPVDTEPQGNRSLQNAQLLSHSGSGGWTTEEISIPHQEITTAYVGNSSEYKFFSTDLSAGVIEPLGNPPLSPSASERTPYLRGALSGTGFCTSECFRPLVTGCPAPLIPCAPAIEAAANVRPGTEFQGPDAPGTQGRSPEGVEFAGASPDGSRVILKTIHNLVAGFDTAGGRGLYRWAAGSLRPVSILPGGEPTGAALGNREENNKRGAVSAIGDRVVFTVGAHLYLRDVALGQTVQLDAPAGGTGGGLLGAEFQGATRDASKIFFGDDARLTAGSTATPNRADLYMCRIAVVAGALACELHDLTVAVNPGETADVQASRASRGTVSAFGDDGRYVYFAASGVLAAGASPGDCSITSGKCNLYVRDTESEETRLVATVSGVDKQDWILLLYQLANLTARSSPDGRYFTFMSQHPLTGYDNRDAKSGQRDQEVYLYDAQTDRLRCASCNPSGARPRGIFDQGVFPGLLVDRPLSWGGRWLAASVPGWTGYNIQEALYQSRYLSNSGRLFFNAADSLVPQDSNGVMDVYQYEPPGVGSCTVQSPTYGAASGGCVHLISSGTSPEESAFLDASESGNDVFFLTSAQLTGKDVDGAADIYDAKVGGGETTPVSPPACEGDACQAPATPPNFESPGTALIDGPENPVECPHGKVKKSSKCVKQKSKKKHHKKSNKKKGKKQKKSQRAASHNRGGSK